jgi:hypothetical protein
MSAQEPEVQPGAEPTGEPTGGEPEPWAFTQEMYEEQQQGLQSIASYIEEQRQREAAAGQPSAEIPDPYADPEAFQGWLDSRIEERTAPYGEYVERAQTSEGEQMALDVIADIEAREGEFLVPETSRPLARMLADDFWPEAVERFGTKSAKAGEFALEQAYKQVRELEQAIGKAYHERQINELRGLAGARREPAAAGAQGAQELVIREGGDELDLARSFFPS